MLVVWTCISVGVILAIWVGIAAWRARKPPFNPPVLTRLVTPEEQKVFDAMHRLSPNEQELIDQMRQRVAEQRAKRG